MKRLLLPLLLIFAAAAVRAQTFVVKAVDQFPVEVPPLFVAAPVMVEFDQTEKESTACKNSDELLASIDRLAFSLRARYWASRIAAGESRGEGFNALLATIRSRYQRRRLDLEVRQLSTSAWTKPLDPQERLALEEFEWESRRLKRLCGAVSAARAEEKGDEKRVTKAP